MANKEKKEPKKPDRKKDCCGCPIGKEIAYCGCGCHNKNTGGFLPPYEDEHDE